jgi:hypothetical protein
VTWFWEWRVVEDRTFVTSGVMRSALSTSLPTGHRILAAELSVECKTWCVRHPSSFVADRQAAQLST